MNPDIHDQIMYAIGLIELIEGEENLTPESLETIQKRAGEAAEILNAALETLTGGDPTVPIAPITSIEIRVGENGDFFFGIPDINMILPIDSQVIMSLALNLPEAARAMLRAITRAQNPDQATPNLPGGIAGIVFIGGPPPTTE